MKQQFKAFGKIGMSYFPELTKQVELIWLTVTTTIYASDLSTLREVLNVPRPYISNFLQFSHPLKMKNHV